AAENTKRTLGAFENQTHVVGVRTSAVGGVVPAMDGGDEVMIAVVVTWVFGWGGEVVVVIGGVVEVRLWKVAVGWGDDVDAVGFDEEVLVI
ncbi:hypothetical protein Tco_0732444, partial [Tanacetum coccineum]